MLTFLRRIFTVTPVTVVSTFSLVAFFSVPGDVDIVSDPKILYDARSGRAPS